MKKINIRKWVVVAACICSIGLVSQTSALALAIGDTRDLGLIDPNHPASPAASEGFIDILLNQAINTGPTVIGANGYTRTGNDPLGGNYPDAVFSGVEFGGGVTNIALGDGYLYLLAKYDGPNYGSVVWYVGGLTGNITIPEFAINEDYQVSHTYLFNPGGTGVPDGGSTMALFGFAIGGLGLIRRKIRMS